jgi:hypothetical protein
MEVQKVRQGNVGWSDRGAHGRLRIELLCAGGSMMNLVLDGWSH